MKELKSAVLLLIACTILCGGLYPAIVTGVAQLAFPHQANGSLIRDEGGRVIGSKLIGQPFDSPEYFWPRPSATDEFAYNPLASGGSNFGPTNPEFLTRVTSRTQHLRITGMTGIIPADLVLASASGLDPHITPAAALAQVPRITRVRGLAAKTVETLVSSHIETRFLGIFGEPRVNVLALNLALDRLAP